jgi:DMSO/TMAO reductase YedYZ molybdopterin-dependent catalytic subunit
MPDGKLTLTGDLANPLTLTLDNVRDDYPRATITTQFETDNGLITATFAGARLWDVIASAGRPSGAFYVQANAVDGWGCTLRQEEFDPSVKDHRLVLIAYERDGGPLPSRDGLFRLVVPGDGPGRRYVRGLAFLTVFEGYPPAEAD